MLYGKEAAQQGIELTEVDRVYADAYRRAEANRGVLDRLVKRGDWIVIVLAALALWFRNELFGALSRWLGKLRGWIYARAAGTRLFRSIALKKYREALRAKYARIVLPFRPDKPLLMEDVYVPLRLKGALDADLVEAAQSVREHQRVMVVGVPGAGKSMLLKNLAFRYSRLRLEADLDVVPLLLELSRFNDSDAPITDMIVDAFDRNDFPHAQAFVAAALEAGALMLLFDGLDEVNSAKRSAVAQKIRDFVDRYKRCRVVITCRTAVYKNEFAGAVGITLEVAEFTEQQVRTFLTAWQRSLPAGKTVERFMQTLRERPQIMLVARNPLLLTIIAFIYSDPEFELPHSRAHFYDRAVDVLLDQWNVTHNHYSAAQKFMVLRRLALANHDGPVDDLDDVRTMRLPVVLRAIQSVLPDLNLANDQAQPILDEIVERSGLLMRIDGGERCQFAHLTLQEFMAATALRDEPNGLLQRFHKDPDAWREVVKLWCGLDVNSTPVIEEIAKLDPVMAFECLADALNVSGDVANRIIDSFLQTFGEDMSEPLLKAFAVVASDNRPRGKELFDGLAKFLQEGSLKQQAKAAIVLSMTNLPRAAVLLMQSESPYADIALSRMGDVAVPAIVKHEGISGERKLELLHRIGTPTAAKEIVPFLWHEDLAYLAAGYIAALLSNAGVEEALAMVPLSPQQKSAPSAPWVWKPFEQVAPPLAAIVNRAAHLIAEVPDWLPPSVVLDNRILTALLVEARERAGLMRMNFPELMNLREYIDRLPPAIVEMLKNALPITLKTETPNTGRAPAFIALLQHADLSFAERLIPRLFKEPEPGVDDWLNIRKPVDYAFATGWHLQFLLALTAVLPLAAAVEVGLSNVASGWKLLAAVSALAIAFALLKRYEDRDAVAQSIENGWILAIFPILAYGIVSARSNSRWEDAGFLGLSAFVTTVTFGSLWYSLLLCARIAGLAGAIAIVASWIALILALWFLGKRRERAAQNALHGLLDPARA